MLYKMLFVSAGHSLLKGAKAILTNYRFHINTCLFLLFFGISTVSYVV